MFKKFRQIIVKVSRLKRSRFRILYEIYLYTFIYCEKIKAIQLCSKFKGELRLKMNLWSNNTSVPTVVDRSVRFVFMIIECKESYL